MLIPIHFLAFFFSGLYSILEIRRAFILLLISCVAWGQSSLVSSTGAPFFYPSWMTMTATQTGAVAISTLNGASIKASQCGFVNNIDAAAHTLQNIHFRFGNITKSGGTTLRVGIQGVSTTDGPPIQPNGTFASSGNAFANIANASIPAANLWLRSGTVGGSLSISNGDKACMVVEVDAYAGSDSISISGASMRFSATGESADYNGSVWASSGARSMFHLLEYTDGTFGVIGPALPFEIFGSVVTYNSGSTPDEYANQITPATSMRVRGICAENPYSTSTGDVDFVLYNGTTVLATASLDAQQLWLTGTNTNTCGVFATPITLTSGNTYYAAIKPTTTNNIRVVFTEADTASYWVVTGGGTDMAYATRTDAGSWTTNTARRNNIYLMIDQVGNPGGGGATGAYVVAQ